MIYTVTLNPALDYVLKLDKLDFEDINRADRAKLYFGGKGINVSKVLCELESENIALGFAGGFTGEKLESLLSAESIKTDFVHINGDTRINVKIRYQKELDINVSGPEISESEINELIDKLDKAKQGDYVVFAGSVSKNLPSDVYERMMKRCAEGVNFVVDAEGDLLLNSLKYKPFLIKPNHHELAKLFGTEIKSEEDVITYAKKLRGMGAKNVLVSLAENGAVLLDENNTIHRIKNAEGTLINSVGCGDSMVAGFISGYIKTGDYAYSLKLATACANATAYSEGLASREQIEKLIKG